MTTKPRPILTSRETAKLDLLRAIDRRPGCCKADIITARANKTRAHHYRLIDDLIRRGLVRNATPARNAYTLHTTDAGRSEISYWDAEAY